MIEDCNPTGTVRPTESLRGDEVPTPRRPVEASSLLRTDDSTRAAWMCTALDQAETLTSRQLEVFLLLADGLSARSISQELGISEHTVGLHTTHILRTLRVNSRLQAGLTAYVYKTAQLQGRRAAGPQTRPTAEEQSPCGN